VRERERGINAFKSGAEKHDSTPACVYMITNDARSFRSTATQKRLEKRERGREDETAVMRSRQCRFSGGFSLRTGRRVSLFAVSRPRLYLPKLNDFGALLLPASPCFSALDLDEFR
jgi:hypothetical protein